MDNPNGLRLIFRQFFLLQIPRSFYRIRLGLVIESESICVHSHDHWLSRFPHPTHFAASNRVRATHWRSVLMSSLSFLTMFCSCSITMFSSSNCACTPRSCSNCAGRSLEDARLISCRPTVPVASFSPLSTASSAFRRSAYIRDDRRMACQRQTIFLHAMSRFLGFGLGNCRCNSLILGTSRSRICNPPTR